jgi:lysylphosphatidylglycerol synthetase-like protein (DUF2156 family)
MPNEDVLYMGTAKSDAGHLASHLARWRISHGERAWYATSSQHAQLCPALRVESSEGDVMRSTHIHRAPTLPRYYPLISFFLGMVSLYAGRLVFFGGGTSAAPRVRWIDPFQFHVALAALITAAGLVAVLVGAASLRHSAWRTAHAPGVLLGMLCGAATFILGAMHVTFLLTVAG